MPAASSRPAEPLPVTASSPNDFSHRERVIIIFGLMLGMFLAALDQTIVATALPRMAADLKGEGHLSWVVSAYLLTSTAVTPIYGKLSDLYGRKRLLQIAIVIFVAMSLLCGLAGSMTTLILFRGLQGIGGGGLLAMAHATIADVISPRERGRYQGYIASVFAASSVAGPVLGGLFVDYASWRWVFWINLPIGLAALAVSQLTLRRLVAKRLRHKIDYAGALLLVSAVCCVLLITTMGGNEVAWNAPLLKVLGGLAVLFFAACIWQERRAPEPILPPRLFSNAIFTVANAVNFLNSLVMLGGIVFLPLFLQMVFGLSADASGLMLIPLTATTVLGALTGGQLVARTGRYKRFPPIGLSLLILGMLLLGTAGHGTSLVLLGVYMGLSGLGIGLTMPVLLVAVQNSVEIRDLGAGTASITFFRSMGGSLGVAIFGALLIARLKLALPADLGINAADLLQAGTNAGTVLPAALRAGITAGMEQAFQSIFFLGAGIAGLALAFSFCLREVPLRSNAGSDAAKATAAALSD